MTWVIIDSSHDLRLVGAKPLREPIPMDYQLDPKQPIAIDFVWDSKNPFRKKQLKMMHVECRIQYIRLIKWFLFFIRPFILSLAKHVLVVSTISWFCSQCLPKLWSFVDWTHVFKHCGRYCNNPEYLEQRNIHWWRIQCDKILKWRPW